MGTLFQKFRSLLLIFCFISACQKPPGKDTNVLPEQAKYYIAISNAEMRLDIDSHIAVGGGDWGGTVVLYVNGNPKDVISYGGKLTYLTFYIKPGENTISLKGSATEDIYIKVFEMNRAFKVKKIFVAEKVTPDKINEFERTVTFNTSYTPDYYYGEAPKLDNTDNVKLEELVVALHKALINENKNKFEKIIVEGANRRSNSEKGKVILKSLKKSIKRRYFSNSIIKYGDFAKEEIKIIRGNRTALIYYGFTSFHSIKNPYLFQLTTNDCESNREGGCEMDIEIGPLNFAYIDKKWTVWESNL